MRTHEEMLQNLLSRPEVKAEVERIEQEEVGLLAALLKARQAAGLIQADAARAHGGTSPSGGGFRALAGYGQAFAIPGHAEEICSSLR